MSYNKSIGIHENIVEAIEQWHFADASMLIITSIDEIDLNYVIKDKSFCEWCISTDDNDIRIALKILIDKNRKNVDTIFKDVVAELNDCTYKCRIGSMVCCDLMSTHEFTMVMFDAIKSHNYELISNLFGYMKYFDHTLTDNDGYTAVHRFGQLIADKNYDPNVCRIPLAFITHLDIVDPDERNLLHYISIAKQWNYVNFGMLVFTQKYLAALNYRDVNGCTPMVYKEHPYLGIINVKTIEKTIEEQIIVPAQETVAVTLTKLEKLLYVFRNYIMTSNIGLSKYRDKFRHIIPAFVEMSGRIALLYNAIKQRFE